jgi:tetratricopeptide (TPR) repeat protein
MPRILFASSLVLFAALSVTQPAGGQIGKPVSVPAGSPEDHALAAIAAAHTNADKLALLDKFMAQFGKGDMAVLADGQYVEIYTAEKQYDKAFEYGDQGLAADPDNYSIAYAVFRAAQEKGDVEHEFRYGLALAAMVTRYKAKGPPAGMEPRDWETQKKETLAEIADAMNYVSGTLFNAARGVQDAKLQAELLERYAIAYADSPYAEQAQTLVADSYRRMRDYAKMTSFAQQVLEKDPGNVSMLLLLADDGSDRGVDLKQADEYAHKALELIEKQQKPAGASEEQWTQRIAIENGIAWSSIGQVATLEKHESTALGAFEKAAPLLKSQTFLYARNQYRLGFALLNLKRVAEARTALTEAASLDTPYRPLAQEKLNSLGAAPAKRKRRP